MMCMNNIWCDVACGFRYLRVVVVSCKIQGIRILHLLYKKNDR